MILGMLVGCGVKGFVGLAAARAPGSDFATGSATRRGVTFGVRRERIDALPGLSLPLTGGFTCRASGGFQISRAC